MATSLKRPEVADYGNYFVAAYPPFSAWTRERLEEVERRLAHPPSSPAPELGLYLHIPFCEHRCRFCYYLSHDDRGAAVDDYLEALERELSLLSRMPYVSGRRLAFAYVGGGTPSLLSTRRLSRLLQGIRSHLPWDEAREVTVECAPRSITAEKLSLLRDAGVTRLSLGVQQLDDEVLRRSGRVHLTADAERAWAAVERADFPVANVDLMVGLPGETDETVERTLERVVAWAPESVTVYQLEIPLNTPLYRILHGDPTTEQPPAWPVKRARLGRAFALLEEAGYTVATAYAAVKDTGRHRFAYQQDQYRGADLLGAGVASFSYLDGIHHQNRASLDGYLGVLADSRLPLGRAYALDRDERLVRELVLQLKLGSCSLGAFREKFDVDLRERFAEPLSALAREGLLRVDDEAVRLTRAGLLEADAILPSFYLPRHRRLRYS